ncbi:DMT family transporter [uncultured Desulfovibrio sp.]|uniref:DMT family transporter n=1 Tax=uncultured Desulfovibrio sp. TaxID=167968 RepID=UPI00266C0C82|nr:DMT family transporter [uncultured Desulfovibrio sp.]
MLSIRSSLLPHLALLTAMSFWGSTFVALRVALAALTPLQTMSGRMLVACLALLPVWPRLFRELRRNGHWALLLLMGLCEPCLFFLFETHALRLTTASQAGMVTALLPLLVAAAAYVALGERSGPRAWLGFALAVGGVVWLSGTARAGAAAPNPALGNLLEAAAMCCATGYTLLARRLSPFYSPLCITAVQAGVGLAFFSLLLCFVPESAARVDLGRDFPAWAAWACVAYLGGCVTFAGYGLYNLGVNRLSAGRAAAYTNLIPVFAMFFGMLLLDERLSPGQYGGAVCIVAGVLCSQWRGGAKEAT